MKNSEKYYKHSGTVTPIGICSIVIAGGLGTIVLSVIYAYASFIPLIIMKLFLPFGFGAGVGIVASLGGWMGKVRNIKLMAVSGLCFGVLGEYAGWVVWLFASSTQRDIILYPPQLMEAIILLASTGSGQIFGWTPKGGVYYAISGLEAMIIIGTSTLLSSVALVASTPFCERCKQWIVETASFSPLEPILDESSLRERLEREDYATVKALKRTDDDAKTFTKIELLRCATCRDIQFISVRSVETKKAFMDKPRKTENAIILNLAISKDTYEMLMADLHPYQETQTIEMDRYTVDVPLAHGYKVESEKEVGRVRITKMYASSIDSGAGAEVTMINISYNNVLPQMWKLSEGQVADHYRDEEIEDMKTRGVLPGDYELHDIRKNVITVERKKLYTLSYNTMGGKKFGDKNMQAAILYLYFPPDFADEHIFYLFHLSLFGQKDNFDTTHIPSIESTIKYFHLRSKEPILQ